MTDCLATTGSDTLLPFIIIAAVLFAAGVVAVFAAKKRTGWSAFLVIPLLLGVALFGSAAPSAQAASGVPCSTATPAPAVETPTPTPTPTPTETPSCTPSAALPSFSDTVDNWTFRNDDGFFGFYSTFSPTDGPTVQALIDASTTQPAQVTVTADVLVLREGEWTPDQVSYTVPLSQGGTAEAPVLLGTEFSQFIYLGVAPLDDAIDTQMDGDPAQATSISAVVTITQNDGCGGVVLSTITFSGPLPLT